ncbi:hypothetical protein PCC7424_3739 [Gloeothece citriformis PCC 7424]|uniref:Uncharacterized protein n=2 Tax=Gloeothece TaxID=28070 RepID=B7KI23_GLOC7|nr:hypothetical protein PCC7424_3739 [Gloeothece citriformis PCC 7424]
MVEPNFKSMSYDELIDYALEQGEGCGALEEYVNRLKNDPQTIILDPNTNSNWAEQLIEQVGSQYPYPVNQ